MMRNLARKRLRLILILLLIGIFFSPSEFINNIFTGPYYNIEYPKYKFISEPDRPVLNICSPFNLNKTQFKVMLDDQLYPKITPLFYNQSINFSCLNSSPRKKLILLWNKFVGLPNIQLGSENMSDLLLKSNCPVTNCELTMDRERVNSSDMILFHMRSRIDKFPKYRFSNQKWVYCVYESQQHCPMCSKLDNLFNLSSTFSSTSDITSIYLSESRLKWTTSNLKHHNPSDYSLGSKTGFAVILISDCNENLNRLKIIHLLREHIPVDIYGKCSDQGLKCPKIGDCREYLAKRYKFFFTFENSYCREYVSEKFFNTLNYDTIPVVLGAGEYSKFVPKSAFINVMNYASLNELADYLKYLSRNQTAYSEYFKWKQFIEIDTTERAFTHYCEMCISLQMEEFTGIRHNIFKDHSKLFTMQDNCLAIKFQNVHGTKFFKLDKNGVQMKYLES